MYPCGAAQSAPKRQLSHQRSGQAKSESMKGGPDNRERKDASQSWWTDKRAGAGPSMRPSIQSFEIRSKGSSRGQPGAHPGRSTGIPWRGGSPWEAMRGWPGLFTGGVGGGGERRDGNVIYNRVPFHGSLHGSMLSLYPKCRSCFSFLTNSSSSHNARRSRDLSSVKRAPSSSPPSHLLPCIHFIPNTQ